MIQQRIAKLRSQLKEYQVEGILVTDPYNRRYITGFTGTAGIPLITTDETLFITDFRYVEQAAEQAKEYQIIEHKGTIGQKLAEILEKKKISRLGFEQHHLTYATYQDYSKQFSKTKLVPLPNLLIRQRMIKDEQEIELIRQAVKIVDQAFEYIVGIIKPGMKEVEVALELEYYMRKLGAQASAFDIIVASGARSALPHGVASSKVIEPGDFVTLDFGAVYQGYCSDITRTIAVGNPPQKLKDIYAICLEAQERGVTHIKPGLTGREADAICRDYITEHGYGAHFGHSTGHGLGLEVHEFPRLSHQVEERLQPGMVVTVEPGIYISGLGGVRIEDDLLLTEAGNEVLTRSPKELIIIN